MKHKGDYFIWASLLYELSFLSAYFSNRLVAMNTTLATIYWLSAGLFGTIAGTIFLLRHKVKGLIVYLCIATATIGFVLLCMFYMAIMVTAG